VAERFVAPRYTPSPAKIPDPSEVNDAEIYELVLASAVTDPADDKEAKASMKFSVIRESDDSVIRRSPDSVMRKPSIKTVRY